MTPVDPIGDRLARFSPRPGISHVVFDFDGTLSWLRHGWPELMAGLFLKHIPRAKVTKLPVSSLEKQSPPSPWPSPPGEGGGVGPAAFPESNERTAQTAMIHSQLLDDILSLNGKSSIYQMQRCSERVIENGGPKLDPQQMLAQYQAALEQSIAQRKEKIKRGDAQPDEFVVHGARTLLQRLHARGLVLVILSGTVQEQVKEEAELLGLTQFFGPHIYGSTSDLLGSSKQAVIERLMRQEQIAGEHLLSFGDGPVEIRLTKQAGGLAVGVASDEDHNGSGTLHRQKAQQLQDAGADLLIPDYREPDKLVKSLLGS